MGASDGVTVIVRRSPFVEGTETYQVAAGQSIAEILEWLWREHDLHPRSLRVTVGADVIPLEMMQSVRVRNGVTVNVVKVPNGKAPEWLAPIMTVGVTILATVIAGPLGTAAGGFISGLLGLTGASATLAASLATAAIGATITIAGNLAVRALFPIAPPTSALANLSAVSYNPDTGASSSTDTTRSPSYSIGGGRNEYRPYGVIPDILGEHRVSPIYGAKTYTESIGNDQYLTMLFVWGYGPLTISDIRIGETPISEFENVEIISSGDHLSGAALSIYPNSVYEEQLSIDLTGQTSDWKLRTSAVNTDKITVDIAFPNGLFYIPKTTGVRGDRTVSISVQYAPRGSGSWTQAGIITVTAATQDLIRKSLIINPPSRAQYDVRIISLSPAYSGDDFVQESVYWISIKSTRYENPIKFNKPLTVTALRIKASAQLNGTIEQLNGVVSKRLKSYVFGTWLDNQISSNPADLFRHVLQSNANERPVKDEEIDLASLAEWHDYCRENGFEFNQIRDFSRSVEEVLRDIASSGRASVSSIDGKWSVIFDRPNPIVVQHFTPRNSKNFEATYSYFEMPHGFRVRFINEENNYLQDERVVYDDGYNETNATLFEGLEFPGVTKPSLIWKHGRYHIAQLRLRPATYTLQTDWEHLVCNRGDLVVVQHDVPQWGSGAARVKNVDEANQTVTLDDGMVMEIGKRYALRCRYQDGDSFIREVITNENEGYTLSLVGIGSLPNIGDLVMFGIYGQESKKMRVLSKEPLSDHEARLSLVAHAPEIMDADKGNIPEYVSGTPPRVNYWSYPPKNLSGYEVLSLDGTGVVSNLNIFWQPPAIGIPASYIVQIRKSPTEDYITQTISAPTTSTTFYSVPQGSYEVRVRAFFQYGQVSNWETINGVIVNKLYVPPPTVSNFSISVVGDTATLSWDKINDLAVAKYIIKFANVQNDASWANSVTLDGNLQSAPYQTTARGGAWLIKAVSVGGLESEEAAIVYSNVSGLTSFNAVETITENPSFSGNKTQSVAVDDDGHLRLISTDDIFAIQDIFSVQDIFLLGGIASAGIYNFANEIDLGEQYSVRLSSFITAYGQSTTTDIFAIQDIFSVQNIFNEEPSQWDVIIEYRYSTDAISPSTPWSAWSSISLSDVIGRSFQFRAVMYSKKYDITPVITNLGVQIDVPDRVVADNNILASPYGENVLFAKPFMKLQGLGINAENMATGDYYSVTNKTNHGFTIKFFNASGTGVSRRFDYIAKGYGVTT